MAVHLLKNAGVVSAKESSPQPLEHLRSGNMAGALNRASYRSAVLPKGPVELDETRDPRYGNKAQPYDKVLSTYEEMRRRLGR